MSIDTVSISQAGDQRLTLLYCIVLGVLLNVDTFVLYCVALTVLSKVDTLCQWGPTRPGGRQTLSQSHSPEDI